MDISSLGATTGLMGSPAGMAIGGAASAIGAIWQQSKADEKAREAKELNDQMINDVKKYKLASDYRNSDASASTQARLTNMKSNLDKNAGIVKNRAVAGGMTKEQELASMNASNNAFVTGVNNAFAEQENRKAATDARAIGLQSNLNVRAQNRKDNEARSHSNLASNLIGSVGDLMVTYNGLKNANTADATKLKEANYKAVPLAGDINANGELNVNTPLVNRVGQSSNGNFQWSINPEDLVKAPVENPTIDDNGYGWAARSMRNMGTNRYRQHIANRMFSLGR